MNFNHYVPILKSKRGELDALSRVGEVDRILLTPLLELPPADFDDPVTLAAVIQAKAQNIARAWGVDRPVFVDPRF